MYGLGHRELQFICGSHTHSHVHTGFTGGSVVKNPPAMQEPQETQVQSLGCWEDPLQKGLATHSSIPAWRRPWTEEPGGLQSVGLQRLRDNCRDLARRHMQACAHTLTHSLEAHLRNSLLRKKLGSFITTQTHSLTDTCLLSFHLCLTDGRRSLFIPFTDSSILLSQAKVCVLQLRSEGRMPQPRKEVSSLV